MSNSLSIPAQNAKEIVRCGTDPIYFINKYIKIQHPIRGAIPFSTYDFQDNIVKGFQKHRFNIVLKSRQLGLSTITAAYSLWLILFNHNVNILVIATKLAIAKNFIAKCKYMLKNLPPWLMLCEIDSETVQSITTSKGSVLKAVPTSEDAGRSEALTLLVVDEAAFIPGFEELWKGLLPCISTGGRAILISSPNGTQGKFYELYSEAESKKNSFNFFKLHWSVHPEHDQKWFDAETKNMTAKEIAQEYLCDFQASGDTFLDYTILENVRQMVKEPIKRVGIDRNIWVWAEPNLEHKYILSADSATGGGRDYSAFQIIDCTDSEVVAEYKGKLPPDRFAELVNEFGLKYNKALVCPENNSVGYAVLQKLVALKYPKIYNNKEKTLDVWSSISNSLNLDPNKPLTELGLNTNGPSKRVFLTKTEELLRNEKVKIYSSRLYEELKTFIWLSNHKVGAESKRNDDLVMSLAIGLWLYDTCDMIGEADEKSKMLLDSIGCSSVKLDNVINNMPDGDDFSVFLPVAVGSNKNMRSNQFVKAQKLNNKWKWLMS